MTERELQSLKSMPVPPARAEAKRAALDAAMGAFDSAQSTSVSENENAPQGNVVPLRQTATTVKPRRFSMPFSYRPSTAIAASLIAMAIMAPLAFHQFGKMGGEFQSVTDNLAGSNDSGRVEIAAKAKKEEAARTIAKSDPAPMMADEKGARVEPEATAAPAKPAAAAPAQAPAPADVTVLQGATAQLEAPPTAPESPPVAAKRKMSGLGAEGLGGAGGEAPAARPSESGASNPYVQDLGKTFSSHQTFKGAAAPSGSIAALDQERKAERYDGLTADTRSRTASEKDLDIVKSRYGWMGGEYPQPIYVPQQQSGDKFDAKAPSPTKQVVQEPVSTFSLDVDTASYSFVRRALMNGQLPPRDAVRVEEMINYFPYNYAGPTSAEVPFKPSVTVMPAPWNPSNKLVHVAVKGYDLARSEKPRANLVFLMDVSGSMQPADRLPLVKNAFKMLLDQLQPEDTIAIVTYAGNSGIALEPTPAKNKRAILNALDNLGAGGSTAGAAGLRDAYRLAEQNFEKNAINRIILATDGDFNVGMTDQNELKLFVERKRESGIFLSILGVGQGNHNDALMQTLAQNGNGTASYVDTLNEARKVLVEEAGSTLFTIAKDVKVQIEWNPAAVAEYRLIGYESRALAREDFNNDRVDAGDIGSGHTVTAIYEVTPVGAPRVVADDLRYQNKVAAAPAPTMTDAKPGELGFLKLRYKRPNEDVSKLVDLPITALNDERADVMVSSEVRFSTAVAAFGELLRNSGSIQRYTYDDVIALAQSARGDDPFGYRAEFINLVRLAKAARE
jgi:Ca-activated chloride channel homolog